MLYRQRLLIETRGRGTHEITQQVHQIVDRSGTRLKIGGAISGPGKAFFSGSIAQAPIKGESR
jgi:hypothetical protein